MRERLFKPVEIAPLVWFRILFGAVMLWEVRQYFHEGWIESAFMAPRFHFTFYGFGWVHPWAGNGMKVHFAVLGVLAAMILAGAAYRLAMALFLGGFLYVFLVEQSAYLHHFYLILLCGTLLLAVPANAAFSVDAWLRPSIRRALVPAWTVAILRFQVAVPYVFGGLVKLNGDWMLRGEPMRTWMEALSKRPGYPAFMGQDWLAFPMSWAGAAFDLGIVPLLLWRRTRIPALILAAFFHVTNSLLFDIGIFPWLALGMTLVLFPPRPLSLPRVATRHAKPFAPPGERVRRMTMALLGVWVLIQVTVPLRHLLYRGSVGWTEEGHRFGWLMMLRSKEPVRVRFAIVDLYSPQPRFVEPRTLLTFPQVNRMTPRPDLILQFAHHLADLERQKGIPEVQVYADVVVRYNGRPPQCLIDPRVNLAAQPRNLWHASWICPLEN